MAGKALEGTRVLEYCQFASGPYCTKLLADFGAEVIKIEEPGFGDEARKRGPFPNDIPHPEKSGLFLYLNTNKLGITLDPRTPAGKKVFEELVKRVDILVEDKPPLLMKELALDYGALGEINPSLIMTSITPFGQTGPYRDYKAHQLNISHGSGHGYLLPLPSPNLEREPVKIGGLVSDYDPGLCAAIATLAAVYWRGVSGLGQHIDISKQEALIALQRVENASYPNDGVNMDRRGRLPGRIPGGLMPCKDGYVVVVTPEEHQWKAFMQLIGNPEWSKWEWCRSPEARSENADEITALIVARMKEYTKEEIFRQGQALSCPVSPVASAEDIVNSEQFKARGFFAEINHPEAGTLRYPSAPYKFSETPWGVERPAPLLGEHNEEIYCKRLGYSKQEMVKMREAGVI